MSLHIFVSCHTLYRFEWLDNLTYIGTCMSYTDIYVKYRHINICLHFSWFTIAMKHAVEIQAESWQYNK